MRRSSEQISRWLARQPPLKRVQEEYPQDWAVVSAQLAAVVAEGSADAVRDYARRVAVGELPGGAGGVERGGLLVRQYLAATALRRMCTSAVTGVTEGRLRFRLFDGFVAQRLLFAQGLERKPASARRFRLLWPLVRQRRFLMPLVQPKGIYCFYTREFVRELGELMDGRSVLEIGAGDGTLSRFLSDVGVEVSAIDDFSWEHTVSYGENVVRQDARAALKALRPEVVVCSWPPAGNDFERWVFETSSVQLYVVISSQHEFAAGNWGTYRAQTEFAFETRADLGRLVLPPEADPAVYVFRRF